MTMRMEVFARTRFVAMHQWVDAPSWCGYLGNVHRHEFHVEVGVQVAKSDREVEFHQLKRDVDAVLGGIRADASDGVVKESCELMAMRVASALNSRLTGLGKPYYKVTYVEVSEDGECGGRVIYG